MALWRAVRSRWDGYWFAPAPAIDLDALRIVAVSVQLLWLCGVLWWAGSVPGHLTRLHALPEFFYEPIGIVGIYSALAGGRPPLAGVLSLYWISWIAGLLALIGLYTRASLAVFAFASVFLVTYCNSFTDFHHPSTLLLLTLLILPAGAVGRTLSVDALRRRLHVNVSARSFTPWDPTGELDASAGWPVRLVRVLFGMVYLSAALSKLDFRGGDLFRWANGSTLQYYMVEDGFGFGSPLALWVSELPVEWVSLMSWGSLAFEATFLSTALWPWLARLYVPAGVAFHLGIYATQRATFFQYIALYACFLPARRALLALRARLHAPRPVVLYDGECLLCIRSMTVLQSLDWLDRIDYLRLQEERLPHLGSVDDALRRRLRQEMHVVDADGSLHVGYAAFRRLMLHLPLCWPLLPLLYLPGARLLGSPAYRSVASTRRRFEACDGGACAAHSR